MYNSYVSWALFKQQTFPQTFFCYCGPCCWEHPCISVGTCVRISLGQTLDSYAGFCQTLSTVIFTSLRSRQKWRSTPFAPASCQCWQTVGALPACWLCGNISPFRVFPSLLLRLGFPVGLGHFVSCPGLVFLFISPFYFFSSLSF